MCPGGAKGRGAEKTNTQNFERFQYFNFETDFLEKKNFFQKTGVQFFS